MTEAALPQRGAFRFAFRMPPVRAAAEAFLEREREQLPVWLVVGLCAGIAAWLVLPAEHSWGAFPLLWAGTAVASWTLVGGRLGSALGMFAVAAAIGCSLIWWRSIGVTTPRLDRPTINSFTAQVVTVQQLAARDSVRLTVRPLGSELPPLLRVTVPDKDLPAGLGAGASVRLKARLTPPRGR